MAREDEKGTKKAPVFLLRERATATIKDIKVRNSALESEDRSLKIEARYKTWRLIMVLSTSLNSSRVLSSGRNVVCRFLIGVCCLLLGTRSSFAQFNFEAEPVNYNTAPTSDRVSVLAGKIERGEFDLEHDERNGYLKALLKCLDVPVSSQVLVFSKTSFQLRYIDTQHPRAVYFNDDVYVGFCQNGDVAEISSVDPQQGAIFYTLSQQKTKRPKIVRDQGRCVVCHASSRTSGVPGHLVRSVYASSSGQPFFGSGTFTIDHRSPFEQRWGGWYVTGTHGRQRHMGNVVVTNRDRPEALNVEAGANVTDLSDRVNTKPYLSGHSDIVALMVLEHQGRMHNLITRANFETRSATHYDAIMNGALERPMDHRSDSAKRRIGSAAEKLVEYMLFGKELRLSDKVKGTSGFAAEFSKRGPRDSKGRSLRDFDLSTRMMKYPCSYLIYSEAFDGLPKEVGERVYRRLFDILSGQDVSERFAHLSKPDRKAILEILRETKNGLPDYWTTSG